MSGRLILIFRHLHGEFSHDKKTFPLLAVRFVGPIVPIFANQVTRRPNDLQPHLKAFTPSPKDNKIQFRMIC